ncbi:NAD-dependent epimerase/dehydratase family protein [Umezawaea sp. NPDC059074]|uniref:NAD-dependent epimerase/dehydratase family protein n=1 Tax=Umezawaea sp. NPDC059074 TaxID=3346716 RepID=UPI0036B9BF33
MSAARVVVTGGAGFLGSHLVERLVRDGDDVTVFDVAEPPPDLGCGPGDLRRVAGDVRDADALAKAVVAGVDAVYHLSAVVGVDRYLSSPLDVLDVNVLGTGNVLRLAARVGAKVVVASTSEVYGKNPATPWREDADRVLGSTSTDRWSYSSSKAVAEHLAFAFARESGSRVAVLRYFNVYGPRQRPAYVLSRALHRALLGLPPLIYDDGTQTRCFTFVDDAVAGTVLAGRDDASDGRCFNIGSDVETSVAEAVRLVARLAGADRTLTVPARATLGAAYEDIPRRVPDTSRARDVLGWLCAVPLEEGVRRTVEWARRNRWWVDQAVADGALPAEGANGDPPVQGRDVGPGPRPGERRAHQQADRARAESG